MLLCLGHHLLQHYRVCKMFSTFIFLLLWTRSPSQYEPHFLLGGESLMKLGILFNITSVSGNIGTRVQVFWYHIHFLSTTCHFQHEIKNKLKINPKILTDFDLIEVHFSSTPSWILERVGSGIRLLGFKCLLLAL